MDTFTRQLLEAQGYLELGLFDDAASALEEIDPAQKTRFEVMAMRAILYNQAGNWPLLETVARHLAHTRPDDHGWWIQWAYATRRVSGIEDAEKILLLAAERHPEEACIHFNLGCYACQTGRVDEAKDHVSRAVRLDASFKLLALEDPDLKPLWESFGDIPQEDSK